MLNETRKEDEPVSKLSKQETTPLEINSQQEITTLIDGVLGSLKSKFEDLSGQILTRMDQMSQRMDDLEKSLVDLLESTSDENK